MQTRKCLCETKGAREGSLAGKMNSEKSDYRGGGDRRQEEDGATVASHCLVWVLLFYDVCFQGAPVNSRKATQIKDGSHSFYPSFSPTATAISLAVFFPGCCRRIKFPHSEPGYFHSCCISVCAREACATSDSGIAV